MVAASGERQTSERTRVFPRLWVSRRARARFQATTEQERASKRERERQREVGREREHDGRKAERGSELSLTTPRRFAAQEALSDLRL